MTVISRPAFFIPTQTTPRDTSAEASNVDKASEASKVSDRLIDSVNPQRAFVIFAHGSGQSRNTKDSTIAHIASQINGNENEDYIIVDGPAAGKPPGSYAYNDLDRTMTRKNMRETFGTIAGSSYKTAKIKAFVTGKGSENSAATAVSNIIDLKDKGGIPGTVNIIGYSRGAAVTASQVVHQLKSIFGYKLPEEESQPLKINLFLIDPVAGGSKGKQPINKLSLNGENDNVHIKSLYALYSRDEEKQTYIPQYPKDFNVSDDVKTGFCELPGRHATLGRSNTSLKDPTGSKEIPENEEGSLASPSKLIASYAQIFLGNNGIKIQEPEDSSTISDEHDKILDDPEYKKLKQSNIKKRSNDYAFSLLLGGLKPFKPRGGDKRINNPDNFLRSLKGE